MLLSFCAVAQKGDKGHSHNDYAQPNPFYGAYAAGMGSVEADVFLKNGKLLVAHNEEDTDPERNLEKLYLVPIVKAFKENKGYIYADKSKTLQLLIDIKENHKEVLAELIKELKPFINYFNPSVNKYAVKILISGDVPPSGNFKDYPAYIYFDGRTTNTYTSEELKRLGMVSESISSFTTWNGKGTLSAADQQKLKDVIKISHGWHKPFRFWGTADNKDSWRTLEQVGADWIGTDHPEQLVVYLKGE